MSSDRPRWLSLPELRARRSYKWRAYPADVLPTFVAEMDVTLAEPVTRVLQEALAAGDTGYATPDPELAAAVASFHLAHFGWQLDPAGVRLIPDVMTGVTEVLRSAIPPGSGVVVNTPVYPPFFAHIGSAGCRVVEAPLTRSGAGYALDLDALEAAFAAGASAYLLCNPHNPTGLVLTVVELRRVAELAERFQVLVLADEIHAPLTLVGSRHVPYLSLPEAHAHGIAFVSASKGWNVPGLKCAQLVTAAAPMRDLAARLPGGARLRCREPRCHRLDRRLPRRRSMARRPPRAHRSQPPAARRSPGRPAPHGGLRPTPGDLPGLARLLRAGTSRGTGAGVPRAGSRRAPSRS